MSRSFLAVMGVIALAVAVVAVPSLRRALSSPGVTGGLGEIRGFMAAEQLYAGANGGYFDQPSCLGAPVRCIPGYAAASPVFVDGAMSQLEPRPGYAFQFHAGPAPSPSDVERARASKSSLTAFALVAFPLGSSQRGAFCGDSSGRVCVRRDSTMPAVREGKCPDTCETLR